MIDADLISINQRSAHPATDAERGGPNALHGERERPAALLARQPAERKQRERADIDEGVPGRTFFRRALRRDAAEVINETWHGRDESRDQSCGHEIPGNRFQIFITRHGRRHTESPTAREKDKWKRNNNRMDWMSLC